MKWSLRWRLFKERVFGGLACWWKKQHEVTMLQDDETIYCERCGKVFGKSTFQPKVEGGYEQSGVERRVDFDQALKNAKEAVYGKPVDKEAQAREEWLPKPQSRRRRVPSRSRVPAADHADAIAKHMTGKGKGHHKFYRRMTKKRTSKEELEEN